jgi:hypothetical protein
VKCTRLKGNFILFYFIFKDTDSILWKLGLGNHPYKTNSTIKKLGNIITNNWAITIKKNICGSFFGDMLGNKLIATHKIV